MRFTSMQTDRLHAMYSRTTHPTNLQRGTLVKETGLDMTQVGPSNMDIKNSHDSSMQMRMHHSYFNLNLLNAP